MAGATSLPLQQFIASLDNTSLPKIIQVCSGVYFQGSVYEISGSEVCFSTGDVIKVLDTELLSVCCEDISTSEKFELPINHTGLFKVVPDQIPYSTIEEMVALRPLGLESGLPFTFTSESKMTFDNFTLGAGRVLTVLSVDRHEGDEDRLRCQVQGQQEASAEVFIPFSCCGQFHECDSEERFSLRDIMSLPSLRTRRFHFVNSSMCEHPLVLSPVYQVHAVMNLRKNKLKFPSSLEVDVVDVTDLCKDVNFVTPLSLTEVFALPEESFPAVVEIVEGPETCSMFKCSWLPELRDCNSLVFHKTGKSAMTLLVSQSSRKAQQYFMVSQQYGGRFRKRPREFNSVYELYVASIQEPGLRVNVTRSTEEVEEEGLPALSVGEQLEVLRCERMELPCESNEKQKESVEALLCQCLQEPDDDDEEEAKQGDERQEMLLPMYMQGHFVEVITDSKKYKLKDLVKEFKLPLDVKAVSRDAELETDPLFGFACLRIEGAMLEPTILASFPHRLGHCFEIPTRWLSMSVSLTEDPLPWPSGQPPECQVAKVTEVTDTFFHEFCKTENLATAPPPRPPKQKQPSSKAGKKTSRASKKSTKSDKSKNQQGKSIPTKELADLSLNNKRMPPAPPSPTIFQDEAPPIIPRKKSEVKTTTCKALPNPYVKMDEHKVLHEHAVDVDSDPDYETIDDSLVSMMKKMQEEARFYSD